MKGIAVGHGLTRQGVLMIFLFIPKKEPIKISGVEQHNQRIKREIISENLIVPDDPSTAKKK